MTAPSASTTLPDIRLLAPVARLAGVHTAGVLSGLLGAPVHLVEWTAEIAPSWPPDDSAADAGAPPGWRRRTAAVGGDLTGALEVSIASGLVGEISASLLRHLPAVAAAELGMADSALDELSQILAGAFATVLSGTLQLDVEMSVIGDSGLHATQPVRLRVVLAAHGQPGCRLVLGTDQATLTHVAALLEEL